MKAFVWLLFAMVLALHSTASAQSVVTTPRGDSRSGTGGMYFRFALPKGWRIAERSKDKTFGMKSPLNLTLVPVRSNNALPSRLTVGIFSETMYRAGVHGNRNGKPFRTKWGFVGNRDVSTSTPNNPWTTVLLFGAAAGSMKPAAPCVGVFVRSETPLTPVQFAGLEQVADVVLASFRPIEQ